MTMAPKKRIAMHPASATAGGNIINIASGKGGVGKTWMAISLSHALARQGEKVLLFDADFGLANVDVQLGLNADRDLGGVVAGKINMSQAITPFGEGGFDIIVGKSGSGQLADMGRARLSELKSELWQLAQRYDRVVIDLGAGLESAVRSLTPKGGMTLVVATDEPTSLTDAYAYIKVSKQENSKADMRLVINMAGDQRMGERTYGALAKACRTFLDYTPPLMGIVRRDDRIPDAIRRQTAFLSRHPQSNAAEDLESLVSTIQKQPARPAKPPA
ncbi:MAG: AAA family ATPase [Rhodospirillaceae bacterium]|jgi:flagellar biosynthesis protein FlhG|nr:AAA family ATPase [Rhodospirillaceae bacterium]MBT4491448.1 AAA family ATPase [Rhodospirillaceae bacterium]MBT5193994.1 AAA family ATPase [Rhodospirillaceae bacterium]MBT5894471.1 AAA family ATPase [Rhodospirillaceae bacterium]MBT6429748.1 AAA family ATPase [Rhodospirillaceae bacterium]